MSEPIEPRCAARTPELIPAAARQLGHETPKMPDGQCAQCDLWSEELSVCQFARCDLAGKPLCPSCRYFHEGRMNSNMLSDLLRRVRAEYTPDASAQEHGAKP